jgi:hypothetical protein
LQARTSGTFLIGTLPSRVRVEVKFDTALLAKADAAAKRQGVTRTAWLHRAAFDALGKLCGATEEH